MYRYKNMGKGSARTLKYWLDLGYDKDKAEQMRLSRIPGTFEYFRIYKNLSKDDAVKAKEQYQQKRSNTLKNMIKKYGQVEGEARWQLYKEKQAYSNSFEYKQKRYGWDVEKYEAYNKSRGSVGESNGNYGSSYYDVWVNKYGKDIADKMNKRTTDLKVNIGESNGNTGRTKRPEELMKMREAAINRVIRQGTATAYNKESIPIIEKFGRDNGYNFQHAENGGEYHVPNTVFMVDGYDAENNVVIEFDEKYHFREVQRKKDRQRQEQIGIQLKCKFIRINEELEVTEFDYTK